MWAIVAWIFVYVALPAYIGILASALLAEDVDAPNVEPDSFDFPTQREGTKYAVVFGSCWIENPVVDWYGDITTTPIYGKYYTSELEWGWVTWPKKEKHYYATGYQYHIGMNLILCHGMVDGVKQIKFNDIVAWPNSTLIHQLNADGASSADIDEPDLLGGITYDSSSGNHPNGGGIVGNIHFNYGSSSQARDTYLSSVVSSDISAYRGLTTAVLEQLNVGTSPRIPTVKFLLKRTDILTDGSAQWYVAKADISNSLNAIHIIRECLTNADWGMKLSSALLEDSVWQAAADTLYDEGFGLCLKWEDPGQTLKQFVQDVLRHINARLYEDPTTGFIVIKLIRNDYSVGSLDTYDETDIVEITSFNRGNVYEAVNVLNMQFWNMYENTPVSIPDHDIALMDVQNGKWIERDIAYNGVVNATLAGKLIARERQQAGSFPVLLKIKAKRTMAGLHPGDVFILNYSNPEITGMIMRVVKVNLGTLQEGTLTIDAIQDVFSIQPALYSGTPDSAWDDPAIEPLECPDARVVELPYIVLHDFTDSQDVFDTIVATTNGVSLILATLAPNSANYELMFRADTGDSFESLGVFSYSDSIQLNENITISPSDTTWSYKNWTRYSWDRFLRLKATISLSSPWIGFIGNEIIGVTYINATAGTMTVLRGLYDTVPQTHSIDDYCYFIEDNRIIITTDIPTGDTPGIKILPITVNGTLPEVDADIVNADTFNSRLIRPYPPDDILINGTSYASTFSGQPTITWYDKDRTNITDVQYTGLHTISAEAGTTYVLKIYDETLTNLVRTVNPVTSPYTYDWNDEIADCGLSSGDPLNSQLRFVLYSVRDGYDSYQSIDITVQRV